MESRQRRSCPFNGVYVNKILSDSWGFNGMFNCSFNTWVYCICIAFFFLNDSSLGQYVYGFSISNYLIDTSAMAT